MLVAFVAGAAALWFIDRKNAAVGLALIGIGVASAFFVREVDLETSTQEVWGTIAHLLIAGGIFCRSSLTRICQERQWRLAYSSVYGD